jgi:hypothetical protein
MEGGTHVLECRTTNSHQWNILPGRRHSSSVCTAQLERQMVILYSLLHCFRWSTNLVYNPINAGRNFGQTSTAVLSMQASLQYTGIWRQMYSMNMANIPLQVQFYEKANMAEHADRLCPLDVHKRVERHTILA